jgi:predicted ArsR family transcriptional regulator
MPEWSFITNHALVLTSIAKHPHRTLREIGDAAGITERAAHKIMNDLEEAGYVSKEKIGRRNVYRIHPEVPLKERVRSDAAAHELLAMLGWKPRQSRGTTAPDNEHER